MKAVNLLGDVARPFDRMFGSTNTYGELEVSGVLVCIWGFAF